MDAKPAVVVEAPNPFPTGETSPPYSPEFRRDIGRKRKRFNHRIMTQMLTINERPAYAKKLTAVTYLLYAAGMFTFITTFIATIINYVKMEDVKGTWLESHFRWQIKTFWFAVVGYSIGILLMVVIVGIFVLLAVHLWAIYRVVRGGLNFIDEKAMYVKETVRV